MVKIERNEKFEMYLVKASKNVTDTRFIRQHFTDDGDIDQDCF